MGVPENPPAFPSIETHPSFDVPMHHFGMTLRDHFAGQGLGVAVDSLVQSGAFSDGTFAAKLPVIAMALYAAADAMLAERAKPTEAPDLQHVAYFDEGEFHWMSGIAPRDCELFAERAKAGAA